MCVEDPFSQIQSRMMTMTKVKMDSLVLWLQKLHLFNLKSSTVVSADAFRGSAATTTNTREIAANHVHFSIPDHHWATICSNWKRILSFNMHGLVNFFRCLTFHINMNHKHLLLLLSTKSLDDLAQKFRMWMMRFNYIQYRMSLASNWSL